MTDMIIWNICSILLSFLEEIDIKLYIYISTNYIQNDIMLPREDYFDPIFETENFQVN